MIRVGQQADLFEDSQYIAMRIAEVAYRLNVSEASVRNWVKAGYLQHRDGIGIVRQSFENFCHNVAGKEKLVSRANKSRSSQHDHVELSSKILARLQAGEAVLPLAEIYQNSLSDSYRNKEGIYYTPPDICRVLLADIALPASHKTFCDPCCGSGNFIIEAIHRGFLPQNIYAYDSDPVAVALTKQRIFAETGYKSDTIFCRDFLEDTVSFRDESLFFDVIVTNPPWGKKIQHTEKEKYGKLLGESRNLDSAALFFFAALQQLKEGGFLALLLPEAFFKIAAFQNARQKLLEYKLLGLRDFGRPFKKIMTRAQSFCLEKNKNRLGNVLCSVNNTSFTRQKSSFVNNPAAIINFSVDSADEQVLAAIFSKPYVTLERNAQWGLGIVTGNNKKFCRSEPFENSIPVYKGTDIYKGHSHKVTNFIPDDFSLYQQVAPIALFEAEEKLLYRFISSELVFYRDTEQAYCLNSVNMVKLLSGFPFSHSLIAKVFNTDLYSWIFKKLFNTHKVLRSDLEKLPLPIEFLKSKNSFSESELIEYFNIGKQDNGTFRIKG
ncbi:MAG: DNA methyltransferase [Candidatus Tokpelaia sp.]|nr:MAG: DNA methyltransferase [Candidatus Tokpelaia sp.]